MESAIPICREHGLQRDAFYLGRQRASLLTERPPSLSTQCPSSGNEEGAASMTNSAAMARLCHRPALRSQRDQLTSLGRRVLICALMGNSYLPHRQLWELTPEPIGTPWTPSAELTAASRKHGLLHQSILANHLFCFLPSSLIGLPCALADGLGKRPRWRLGLPGLGTKKSGCSGEEG